MQPHPQHAATGVISPAQLWPATEIKASYTRVFQAEQYVAEKFVLPPLAVPAGNAARGSIAARTIALLLAPVVVLWRSLHGAAAGERDAVSGPQRQRSTLRRSPRALVRFGGVSDCRGEGRQRRRLPRQRQ